LSALGWLGVDKLVLLCVLVPVIAFMPALRVAAGALLLLAGLIAWACDWAVRS
jgi:hypothetical protein